MCDVMREHVQLESDADFPGFRRRHVSVCFRSAESEEVG